MRIVKRSRKLFIYILTSLNLLIPGLNQISITPISTEIEHTDTNLTEELSVVLEDERLNGAVTGLSVREATTGNEIYSHDADLRLRPASNMKLLTGAAALEVLGVDHQFKTEVLTDGMIEDKTLNGNLYLKGKGDPTLSEDDLEGFADFIKEQGIKEITGDLIADDTWYDDVRLSPDLNWKDESNYTGAQVSALTLSPNANYDTGTISLEISPAEKLGDEAIIKLTPETDYITINNNTETVEQPAVNNLSVTRAHGTNEITIEGTIQVNSKPTNTIVAVWEPTDYVLSVFKKKLADRDITIIGDTYTKGTSEEAEILTEKNSVPLKEIMVTFMKLSNNGIGEILTKEIGKKIHDEGSFEKGLQVIHATMIELGVDGRTIMLRDGSGLSHKTMIPARELSKMLYEIQDKEWFPVFKDALPIGGNPYLLEGGSLRFRLFDSPAADNVRAKTGTLTGVSTLSGYVTSADGKELIFSIMINNHLSVTIRDIEDDIVSILASFKFNEMEELK